MIATLSGILRRREAGRVVVETGGVGYEVFIPLSTYYRLPAAGTAVALEIRQVVRDDSVALYGFSASAEKRAFDLLIGVQHVGPKLALAILSVLSPGELAAAVSYGDAMRIDAVPGVGPKMAERVVRELRDKIEELKVSAGERPASEPTADGRRALLDDAVSALVNLDYKPHDARRAVEEVASREADAQLETIIRNALALLIGKK